MTSILKNKTIWLSDCLKMNDKQESTYLSSILLGEIDTIVNKTVDEHIPELKTYANDIIQIMKLMINEYPNTIIGRRKNFIACFSEDADLLSQWRAYANNGNGVSIGINSSYLHGFENLTSYEFLKVVYDEKIITQALNQYVLNYLKTYIEKYKTSINNFIFETSLMLESLFTENVSFKHPAFSEEREWRLILQAGIGNWNDSDGIDDYGYLASADGWFIHNKSLKFPRSELKFRPKNNDIIPYIELSFKNVIKDFIKQIILGPQCEISEYDLRLFLNSQGYIADLNDRTVKIIKSRAPLRG